jgi:small-conductance mechanosensitive channel
LDALVRALPGELGEWVFILAYLAVAILAALLAHFVVFSAAARLAQRADGSPVTVVLRQIRRPARLGFVLLGLKVAFPAIHEHLNASSEMAVVDHALSIAFVVTITWLLIAVVESLEHIIQDRYSVDVADNLQQRKVQTQTRVLARTIEVVFVILGSAAILMTFPGVKQFGVSLLASAGVAGLVVGLAARPVVANLIAGVQIAITQPIRMDDVVIVEGEWGRVEEITATYVVVKIWNERRLVVPLSQFLEHSFQNWTRTSAELLGTVFLYVDYGVPLDTLRAELERFIATRPEWDERVVQIVVTDATERSMEIRALVSAGDSGSLWNLRCAVREHLIGWIRESYPGGLPRLRAELAQPTPGAGGKSSSPSGADE